MNNLVSHLQPANPTSSVGRLLAVTGSVCLFAPLVGVSITVVSMIRSFIVISEPGVASDPAALSGLLGYALFATAIGYGVSIIGIILVCCAIFAFRFTPPWLRSVLVAASLLWLVAFPFGTLIAIAAIVSLNRKRHVFTIKNPDHETHRP